ncbi:MAG: FAD-binding oxidoreductase [Anaerolineae bacterium]
MNPEEMLTKLQGVLSPHQVITSDLCSACEVDGKEPAIIARPQNAGEVAELLALCSREGWGVIPWGSGTQMGIGNIPRRYDVALDLGALDEIVDYDAANLTLTAGAGCTLRTLQELVEGKRQLLPLDPPAAERATLGGVVATNAFGPSRLRYGAARDLVLGLQVALADGEVIDVGGKTVKNVAGYDLTKAFVGSYGTLGVITRVTCRLFPMPLERRWVLAGFDRAGDAFSFVQQVLDSVLLPTSLDLVRGRVVPNRSDVSLWAVIGLEGTYEVIQRQYRDLSAMAGQAHAHHVEQLADEEPEGQQIRRLVQDMPAVSPEPLIVRMYVPIASVGNLWSSVQHLEAEEQAALNLLARPGLGVMYLMAHSRNSHLFPIASTLQALAGEMGGHAIVERIPPEHKVHLDVWGTPRPDWPLMQALKARFDPAGILSPGRFIGRL